MSTSRVSIRAGNRRGPRAYGAPGHSKVEHTVRAPGLPWKASLRESRAGLKACSYGGGSRFEVRGALCRAQPCTHRGLRGRAGRREAGCEPPANTLWAGGWGVRRPGAQ
jgi:hypothetical protein